MASLSEALPPTITTVRPWSSKPDTDATPIDITVGVTDGIGMVTVPEGTVTIAATAMDATTDADIPAIGVDGNTGPSANGFPDTGAIPAIDAVTGDDTGDTTSSEDKHRSRSAWLPVTWMQSHRTSGFRCGSRQCQGVPRELRRQDVRGSQPT